MPVFTIESPDGRRIKIEADNQDLALQGAQQFAASSPSTAAPTQEAPPTPEPASEKKSFGLADTWPVKLAQGLYSGIKGAATLPGDVLSGKVDPLSDEGIGRAFDLASIASPLSPGRLVTQAEKSSIFSDPRNAANRVEPFSPGQVARQQAQDLGVPIPAFATSDSRAVQSLGQAARQLPIGGSIIEKAADRFTQGLSGAAEKISSGLTEATGLDKAGVGQRLRDSIEKAADNLSEVNHSAYSGVRDLINPSTPVKAAAEPLQNTMADIMARRMEAGEEGLGPLKTIANLMQRPGGPTFEGLQRARSQLSKAIDFDVRMGGGMQQGDLKLARQAVTDAMEQAVKGAAKSDPEAALGAWKAADETFSGNMETMQSLSRALRSGSNEQLANHVLAMAGEKAGNAERLIQLQKQIGPENMKMLGSHVVDQAGGMGDAWSAAKFSTNIDKLSNTAKTILFGESRKAVDDLAGLAARWKEQEAKFANKSNTSRGIMTGVGITTAIPSLIADPIGTVLKGIAGATGGVTAGMLLSRPVTAKAFARAAAAAERLANEGTPAAANAYYALKRQLTSALNRTLAEKSPDALAEQ